MTPPRANDVRHRVEPRGVSPAKAARRLGITSARFDECLPELIERGFPPADPTTGNYDLKKIDAWMDDPQGNRATLTTPSLVPQSSGSAASMGERFRAAKERTGHDTAA
jgi:hypothetical protein